MFMLSSRDMTFSNAFLGGTRLEELKNRENASAGADALSQTLCLKAF